MAGSSVRGQDDDILPTCDYLLCSVKRAGYWPCVCIFMDLDCVLVPKQTKTNLANIQLS